jgi:protein-S-isoprenylcysteine O-methyltransferase Ste14
MPASTSLVTGIIRFVLSTIAFGSVLFLAAGTLAWPAAWAYLAVIIVVMGVYGTIIARLHPDLIEERHHPPANAKKWDKPFVAVVGIVGPVALIVLSGLDRRWQWSPPTAAWIQIAGLMLVAAGGSLTNYAVATNRFFSAVVRIQHDRGHYVIDTGPYRFVRHPGYTGSIVYMIGMAFALSSRVALVAAIVITLLLAVRTVLEDRTLHAELDGYPEYAARVRFRLVPGLW